LRLECDTEVLPELSPTGLCIGGPSDCFQYTLEMIQHGTRERIYQEDATGSLICGDTPPEEDCGDCDGKVTELTLAYTGSDSAQVTILQKKDNILVFDEVVAPNSAFTIVGSDKKGTFGNELIFMVNGSEHARVHTSCSNPIGPGLVAGDFTVLSGYSLKGGLLCPVNTPPEPPTGGDCGCKGKVDALTLMYFGDSDANITVETKKEGAVFSGVVASGGTFSIVGNDDKGTLGTEISLYVNGVLNTKIHTSCSNPIGPGLISGDFGVVEGTSREGGVLCPVDEKDCNDGDEPKKKKKKGHHHDHAKKHKGHDHKGHDHASHDHHKKG
jgi:hypothetical protein